MKLVLLVSLTLLAAGTLVAVAPTASAAPCLLRDCSVDVGPCEYGWRWAGTTDEQGFWYPYVECDV